MSVAFTLTAAPTFPQGTLVKAYERKQWGGQWPPQPGQTPAGPLKATSGAVDASGYALFTGLVGGDEYAAGASIAGAYRWVTFRTAEEKGPVAEGEWVEVETERSPSNPLIPSVSRPSFVLLQVTFLAEAASTIQLKVGGVALGTQITPAIATTVTNELISFPCPANVAWEWVKVLGNPVVKSSYYL